MAETVSKSSGLMIETSVLVDVLRGIDEAASYLDQARAEADLVCSHTVEAELIAGAASPSESRAIRQLLARFHMEPITSDDSERAIGWLGKLHHSRGIGFLDCLIAAAAIRLRIPVVTLNVKHFRAISGLKVIRPYTAS